MNRNSTISVFEVLDSTIHTRQAAKRLLEIVAQEECNYIELDFSKVEYVSRSFADEFHSEKLLVAEKLHKTIIVNNANEEVIKMLQVVARTQMKEKRDYEQISIYSYTDWNSLNRFLLSI